MRITEVCLRALAVARSGPGAVRAPTAGGPDGLCAAGGQDVAGGGLGSPEHPVEARATDGVATTALDLSIALEIGRPGVAAILF